MARNDSRLLPTSWVHSVTNEAMAHPSFFSRLLKAEKLKFNMLTVVEKHVSSTILLILEVLFMVNN